MGIGKTNLRGGEAKKVFICKANKTNATFAVPAKYKYLDLIVAGVRNSGTNGNDNANINVQTNTGQIYSENLYNGSYKHFERMSANGMTSITLNASGNLYIKAIVIAIFYDEKY